MLFWYIFQKMVSSLSFQARVGYFLISKFPELVNRKTECSFYFWAWPFSPLFSVINPLKLIRKKQDISAHFPVTKRLPYSHNL